MKNREFYNTRALEFEPDGDSVRIMLDNETIDALEPSSGLDCFYEFSRWLDEEYVKPVKLSRDEVAILRNIDCQYHYISRNYDDVLWLSAEEPKIEGGIWRRKNSTTLPCKHLFKFIEAEEGIAYNIDTLLSKLEGTRRSYYEK